MSKYEQFTITSDPGKLDIAAVHDFLCNHSHWSRNIPIERVKTAIENSLNFGLFDGEKQIGYVRVISDYATIAYLGDVYVLPEYRGQGLSNLLMKEVMSHPCLQGLRRWILLTKDAHRLYEKHGWTAVANPERYMEVYNPDAYSPR